MLTVAKKQKNTRFLKASFIKSTKSLEFQVSYMNMISSLIVVLLRHADHEHEKRPDINGSPPPKKKTRFFFK